MSCIGDARGLGKKKHTHWSLPHIKDASEETVGSRCKWRSFLTQLIWCFKMTKRCCRRFVALCRVITRIDLERERSTPKMGIWARSEFHYQRDILESLRDVVWCHSGIENKTARSISSDKQFESCSHSERRSNSERLDSCQGQFGDFTDRELYLVVWAQFEFSFEEDSWSDWVSFYWLSLRL